MFLFFFSFPEEIFVGNFFFRVIFEILDWSCRDLPQGIWMLLCLLGLFTTTAIGQVSIMRNRKQELSFDLVFSHCSRRQYLTQNN